MDRIVDAEIFPPRGGVLVFRTRRNQSCAVSSSSGLTASIQESAEYQRESQWRREGVPDALIAMSRQSGMDAADMQVFETLSRSG
jgi:hypothetical protein